MSVDLIIGIVGILVGIVGILLATAIAVYAIRDVRREVKKVIKLWRDLAYVRARHNLVWEFIDPAPADPPLNPQIGLGSNEFGLLAQALNPDWTDEHINTAVQKEALQSAETFVASGIAIWKKDYDADRVRAVIKSWQAEKNAERVKTMIGVKDTSII